MRFGPVATRDALGAVLAHAVKTDDARLPKGRLLGAEDIGMLIRCGIESIVVARLDDGDLLEDAAAARIAAAIGSDHLTFSPATTGRINVHAAIAGLFVADRETVDRLNRIDPGVTLACLGSHVAVRAGDMVATIKIIPLAVAAAQADAAASLLSSHSAFEIKPFRPYRTALISTCLPSLKASVMDKTRHVLEDRLQRCGATLAHEWRVAHETQAVADAILQASPAHDLVIVFGASAVTDRQDVIPAAIDLAGGHVEHVGMPVDPGNLLVIGSIGAVPVIGAPGCARSPRENGFDWILTRILAGEAPTAFDITGMGVGGLLMEIPTRPQPRDLAPTRPREPVVRIVVLAAGRASRMGTAGKHKLLAEFDGVPLVRRSVMTAITAQPHPVIVVTGHRETEISAALDGLDVVFAHNPLHATGMASSLIAGLDALGPETDAVLVLLADMPAIGAEALKRMIAAFTAQDGRVIVRAASDGKRGNPVILPRIVFPELRLLTGDVGARQVIETCGLPVIDLDIGPAAHLDLDTPEAILAAGGVLKD